MHVFLSYSSSDRTVAEELAYSLREEGCAVFFDRASLEPGEGYDARIREAIADCDLMIFLLSSDSVSPGSYALSELALAQERWSNPSGRILPVVASKVAIERLPPYLRAVTVLEPSGELVPEVAAVVSRMVRRRRRLKQAWVVGALLVVAVGSASGYRYRDHWFAASAVAVEPVRIIGMLANDGWMLSFDIADREPVREIFYRFADEPALHSTGFQQTRDRRTGLPQPRYTVTVPLFNGKRQIEVAYTGADDERRGPYALELDATAMAVAEAKDELEETSWLGFRLYDDRMFAYFTQLVSNKNALREIRYSLDDETLGQRIHFTPDWSGPGAPRFAEDDQTAVVIPTASKYVSVQLVFADGTESEVRKIPVVDKTD